MEVRVEAIANHSSADKVILDTHRKKHAEEHAEQLRKEARKAERRAREKAAKTESARLEKAMEDERKKRRGEKEIRRWKEAREDYDKSWKDLLAEDGEERRLKFNDIPWPIFTAQRKRDTISLDDITVEAISVFILPNASRTKGPTSEEAEKKDRKEKLRETMLRFHPDKFEGRVMRRVSDKDKDKVKEAVGQVARALNTLMGDGS